MASKSMTAWSLIVPERLWAQLERHLFPGDGDEHGAVIGASIVETPRGMRLLARQLFIACDGVDYVPGQRGYRMLTASFVGDRILDCRDDDLSYLAVHCHGGLDTVEFSSDDLASHERGYPALLDVLGEKQIVGALVFAESSVAGEIWRPSGERVALTGAKIVGRPIRELYPQPQGQATADPMYDRQARIFGERGQALLRRQKVGVIGAGGAGSLIVEYLSRLDVGHVVVVDPERIETTNLPRVVGSRRLDAMTWLTDPSRPQFLQRLGARFSRYKVDIASRVAKQANPRIRIDAIRGNIVDEDTASLLTDCDYLFLAADSMQARLIFNTLVHQYLIPGVQVGAKVQVDRRDGRVLDVFSVSRPVMPGSGCLWCNGLIRPEQLQEEALSEDERRRQRYVDDPSVAAPSVITLNAVAAAHATDDYLFSVMGLMNRQHECSWLRFLPRECDVDFHEPRADPECRECGGGTASRFARGQSRRMPTRKRTTA
jgi:ThiF family